jgi:hypothetical protein
MIHASNSDGCSDNVDRTVGVVSAFWFGYGFD